MTARTAQLARVIALADPAVAKAAQGLINAVAAQGDTLDDLQAFLASEIEKSKRRLEPCVCGHVKMFCACEGSKQ